MIFTLLTLLAALALAAVSGWFSIIGIMSIYAGAAFHALIMGIVLEAGKLVTTSWLYRNWDFADWKLKAPLIAFTITLMLATSIGVFGFLSKSHLEQGAGTIDNGAKIERLDQQIAREKSTIDDDQRVIGQLDGTINSYIGKDRADRSISVRRNQATQRNQLRDDIDAAQKRIDVFSDEKLKLTSEVRKLQLDVGPIRYIAELVYGTDGNADKNIESAVRMFTLIIVSTLDPLAVILLIAANHTILRHENEKRQKKAEDKLVREVDGDRTECSAEQNSSETGKKNKHEVCENLLPENNSQKGHDEGENIEIPLSILQEPLELLNGEEYFEETREGESEDKNGYSDPEVLESVPANIQATILEPEIPQQLPIIRSPSPTRVASSDIVTSRAAQEGALSNIIGTIPHFIPKKIYEEEICQPAEVSTILTETCTEDTQEIEEIPPERQSIWAEEGTDEKIPAGPASTDKYPKALSWLVEFKRN